MLLQYICSERTKLGNMPEDPITVKTIVTTDLVRAIAKEYGVEVIEVLTGFKFIGEQIGFLEDQNEEDRYIFGFEESYGYLAGSYVRDKDAVVASMLICEMAAYYRSKGISLLEARENMYKKYGVYYHTQTSFYCEGETGMERMAGIMENLRKNPPKSIAGLPVQKIDDYGASVSVNTETGLRTTLTLPKSDVIAYGLPESASVIIRPSGTEPKIKAYYTTTGKTTEDAVALQQKLSDAFKAEIGF
jgi:phosphoglucomutase